jgi:hypothetical protein
LAWRLHELEERGDAFTDVLGRIDPDRLRGGKVRDPAALAEWFVEQMAPDLRVVNLNADPRSAPGSPGTSTGSVAGRRPSCTHRAMDLCRANSRRPTLGPEPGR